MYLRYVIRSHHSKDVADKTSLPFGLGAVALPVVLCSQLATAKPRAWICRTCASNDRSRREHACELEQAAHKSRSSWVSLLAHRRCFWHHCVCPRLYQSCSGKTALTMISSRADPFQSYVFCDRAQGITARQVRAKGAVAICRRPETANSTTSSAPGTMTSYAASPESLSKSGDPIHVFTTERRPSLLPSYRSSSTPSSPSKEPQSPTSRYSRASNCTKKKVFGVLGRARQSLAPPLPINAREPEISSPMGVNPQFAHLVQRPDSVLHPSRTGEGDPFRWKAVS